MGTDFFYFCYACHTELSQILPFFFHCPISLHGSECCRVRCGASTTSVEAFSDDAALNLVPVTCKIPMTKAIVG